MISKSYFDNVASKNVLHDYQSKNWTTDSIDNFTTNSSSIENMVINSNLDNSGIIK